MNIGEVTTPCPHYVHPDEPLANAAAAMVEAHMSFMPVVSGKVPVGVVTQDDLSVAAKGLNPQRTPVSKVMRSGPLCLSESTVVDDAARTMAERGMRWLVVLDRTGRFAGLADAERVRRYVRDPNIAKALGALSAMGESVPLPYKLPGHFLG
jgi:CBS domain-containing protein